MFFVIRTANDVASDGVLNPSGIRFGSAEIYSVTEAFHEIDDAICIGQQRKGDANESIVLFLKLKSGVKLTKDLEERVKRAIQERHTHRHVPRYIFEIADIPYTVNGKKCEINVKHIVCGRETTVSGTVANPESLKLYEPYFNIERIVAAGGVHIARL
jgi:acetoacetyl-CoA synthetase